MKFGNRKNRRLATRTGMTLPSANDPDSDDDISFIKEESDSSQSARDDEVFLILTRIAYLIFI